ncbi:Hypothetical protein CINCED_3A000370 [Cinara cedri]|uniref:Uncharacterized protein n=1 Tax=Cinara cedri TaxID=506608 RepID=A0A5E4M5K8_9HEMI|nr:Hypothetical protein CINCED_3A000370 [Cinara cedri]
MDTNTTVVYSVTVRCTTRANSSSIDNSTEKKRQRSPSPTDNVPSKQSKKSPKRDGELQPQLAVSPSRSPTSATYRSASPSYSQNASHSYNDTDASSIHSSYNEQILINCDPANDVGYEADDETDDETVSLMSPSLRYASPPPDLSTGRSLYELLMSASDLTDGDFDDDSAYSSSSSPLLYPTSERHLENPINVPGPQSTGFNAPSLYNSMLPSSYSMAYWPYDLASSSYTPMSPTDDDHILISSDDDHILISSDDDHILISSGDEGDVYPYDV